jgi:hypothetical protein
MFEQLLTNVDLYCERTGADFWSEPVNALTNLAFVAAGLWGVRQVRKYQSGGFARFWPGGWWRSASGPGCSTLLPTG